MSRPQVSVFALDGKASSSSVALPAIFSTPIRPDIIHDVYVKLAKNKRQAYAVSRNAGEQTSAESWGTGRAVARIPRVGGSGTHRSGQAAFGNMCRGGRMFAPTKTWRRWHVSINQKQKRYATASAVAATSIAPLVLARGHKVETIPEVPLVVSNEFESLAQTKAAVAALKAIGAHRDIAKVVASKTLRAGKGKMRGRRFTQRRGPLVIYGENKGLVKALRNIPGVETCSVERLNLLQLAPGSHLGRFVIWTESAVKAIDSVWESKNSFNAPAVVMSDDDVHKIINSTEIQAVIKPAKESSTRAGVIRTNPLKNKQAMLALNPYAKVFSEQKLGSVKADKSAKKAKTPKTVNLKE